MQIWSRRLLSFALAFFGLGQVFALEIDPTQCQPKTPFWDELVNKVSTSAKPHLAAQQAVITAKPIESPRGLWTEAQIPLHEFEKFKGESFDGMLSKIKSDPDVIVMESHPSEADLDFLRGKYNEGQKMDDRLYQPQAMSGESLYRMPAAAQGTLSEVLDQSFRRVMARGAFIPPGAEFSEGKTNTFDKPILLYKICSDQVFCATKTTLMHERLRAYIHEYRQKSEKDPFLKDPHYALAREFESRAQELAKNPGNSLLAAEVARLELSYATHARGETLDVRRMTIEKADEMGLAEDIQGRVNTTQEYAAELERVRSNLNHVESLISHISESERSAISTQLARAKEKLSESDKFLENIRSPLSIVSREKRLQ